MKLSLAAGATALASLFAASSAHAANVYEDKEKDISLNVGFLAQPQMQITQDGAPDAKSYSTDFFLRRARLYVFGAAAKNLTFFFDTDQPNWGKGGVWDQVFIVQDAFMSYEVRRELTIDAGFMLVPLSHHTLEGAASLHAIDYHSPSLHFPATMGKTLRDGGVQIRGLAFGDHLHYRLGVFEGARGPNLPAGAAPGTLPLNEDGEPRFAAQVRANILGVEDKFFMSGIYFADKPMLSIGAGYDYQRHSTRIVNGVSNHAALSGDVFFEYPFSADDEILAKVQVTHWAEGTGSVATGLGTFGEAGFRHKWIEPLVAVDYFHAEKGLSDYYAVRGGLNFWLRKHATNIKAEVAWIDDDRPSGAKRDVIGTVQGQIYF